MFEGRTINKQESARTVFGQEQNHPYPRLQGRGAGAVLCTQEPALHRLGWEEKMVLVLKIKENWSVRMGDAEGHRSGVRPAVAQVWGVRGRAQAGQGGGKTHGVLCCSGDVLAARCLLRATSASSRSCSQLQQGGEGWKNCPETISPTPNKQDELLAMARPWRQRSRDVFWLRCVA